MDPEAICNSCDSHTPLPRRRDRTFAVSAPIGRSEWQWAAVDSWRLRGARCVTAVSASPLIPLFAVILAISPIKACRHK